MKHSHKVEKLERPDSIEATRSTDTSLLKYARITGSLPRRCLSPSSSPPSAPSLPHRGPLTVACTLVTTSLIKIAVAPPKAATSVSSPAPIVSPSRTGSGGAFAPSSHYRTADPWNPVVSFYVAAMAFADGTIRIVDSTDGRDVLRTSVCPRQSSDGDADRGNDGSNDIAGGVFLRASPPHKSGSDRIVGLSFDSGGQYLAAVTSGGDVAVFGFRWGVTTRRALELNHYRTNSNNNNNNDNNNSGATTKKSGGGVGSAMESMFGTFLSTLAGDDAGLPPKPTTTTKQHPTKTPSSSSSSSSSSSFSNDRSNSSTRREEGEDLPLLVLAHPVSTARFDYDEQLRRHTVARNVATCAVLDPSYHRKYYEKSLVVGFSDGRLVYTERSEHGGTDGDLDGSSKKELDGHTKGGTGGGVVGAMETAMDFWMPTGGMKPTRVKRVNKKLHQGKGGIESVVWRGGLISWADTSGIKIYDIDNKVAIAHIDRPQGARASLYPNISSLHPILHFERDNSLLIAWGDCLMNWRVHDAVASAGGGGSGNGTTTSRRPPTQGPGSSTRRSEVLMAWKLDCIACGVVPVDEEHVAVLGYVYDSDDGDYDEGDDEGVESVGTGGDDNSESKVDAGKTPGEEGAADDEAVNDDTMNNNEEAETSRSAQSDDEQNDHRTMVSSGKHNVLKLQIISRSEGTATSSDVLPLLLNPTTSNTRTRDATRDYSLTSSFATARMQDWKEVWKSRNATAASDYAFLIPMKTLIMEELGIGKDLRFLDPHVEWSLESVRYNCGGGSGVRRRKEDIDAAGSHITERNDTIPPPLPTTNPSFPEPPVMIVTSPHDIVLVRTLDADDAVSHARRVGKHATALQRRAVEAI